ncbi:GHMP family kinase ATP-binding protein [Pseudokordiimonas caeni]|uniref:GHMP family kinase ATP-binding protein n=1 Tax=Pseudokordiimonas caeni TaxID=2997908 RepID=UPI0028110DF7|nr:hypothetical protein [Pseudokordiimonas caeni]
MIVARAPYRVSFFGGGTDYPEWFSENGGVFLSSTINHHITIVLRRKPSADRFRYRIVWRELEDTSVLEQIKHPFVRAALQKRDIRSGIDVVYFGDLPHGAGLGSSSTFGVAFLTALNCMTGHDSTQYDLAQEVYEIERHRLGETVGIQDQFAAAFGGFNFGSIAQDGSVSISKVSLTTARKQELEKRLLFIFTGKSREASMIAQSQVANFKAREAALREMTNFTREAHSILANGRSLDDFGLLLHQNWQLKKSLSEKVSLKVIDDLYAEARDQGALGGKVLGAGGGGFLMLFLREGDKERISRHFSAHVQVPVRFEAEGPKVLLNQDQEYAKYYERVWAMNEE